MFTGMQAQTQETVLTPLKDNSIYQEGELSNGAGERLFTGVTRLGNKRRALIKFDLSDEGPEGKGAPATNGDATWTMSSVGGEHWVKPGGDFALETLASATVNMGTDPVFGSPYLAEVVNA